MVAKIQVGKGAMPAVGLGLWKIAREDTPEMVRGAIAEGYCHLDSAADYGNEAEVGEGIRLALQQGLVDRDSLWVTSKLWNTYHRPEHVRSACERTLKDLGLSELDLYLIHFPIALEYVDFETRYPPEWLVDPSAETPKMQPDAVPFADTWGAMEALVEAGLVKEIGVCNYNSGLLHDLMAYAKIKPAMLQIESHPYLTQERLLRAAAQYEMAVTAFSPLGALSYSGTEYGRHRRIGAEPSSGSSRCRQAGSDARPSRSALGDSTRDRGDSKNQSARAVEGKQSLVRLRINRRGNVSDLCAELSQTV